MAISLFSKAGLGHKHVAARSSSGRLIANIVRLKCTLIREAKLAYQSRINIGSDGTFAPGPFLDGVEKGAPNLFSGAPIYLNITKQNIRYRKTRGITLEKILGAPDSLTRP